MNLNLLRVGLTWWIVLIHCYWLTGTWLNAVIPLFGFMLLSGYVTAGLICTRPERYGIYLFRRWVRLFPVFLVCLLLAIAIRPLTLGNIPGDAPRETFESQNWWPSFLAAITMLQGPASYLLHRSDQFLPTAWYVSVQWQFVIFAPLIILIIRKFGRIAFVSLFAFALIPYVQYIHYFRLGFYSAYFAGHALLWQYLLPYLIGITYALVRDDMLFRHPSQFGYTPAIISYSTYLVHYPLLALLQSRLELREPWLLFAVGACPILLASLLLYFLIERPATQLARYLTRTPQSSYPVPILSEK
jgi:peptidoglycan/LPS O-acetylase OafA/YrhL